MSIDVDGLLAKARHILAAPSPRDARLKALCYLLRHNVPHYDWVGFYLVDPKNRRELVLGPYEGSETVHTRIPFGRGICGQVAERKETMVVQDVSAETNYLSCNIDVRSEIVVPVLRDGEFVAQLDIDSHLVAPFGEEDLRLLQGICADLRELF